MEMIVRGQEVEVINYFPNGQIKRNETGTMTLERCLNELEKISEELKREDRN